MQGSEYIDFLIRWELIDISNEIVNLDTITADSFEYFYKEWIKIHESSLQNENIWNDNAGLPSVPTSGTNHINPMLLSNNALYHDRQLVSDPIEIALINTGTNPIDNIDRFNNFMEFELKSLFGYYPLVREDLIEIMPFGLITSKFSLSLKQEIEKDWVENNSLKPGNREFQ